MSFLCSVHFLSLSLSLSLPTVGLLSPTFRLLSNTKSLVSDSRSHTSFRSGHMSAEQQPQQPEAEEATMWSSPVSHFRPNMKFLTVYTDRHMNVLRWMEFKDSWLKPWYMPWFSPLYQAGLWFSQRNRNLWLVENHLNYRPYKWRRDTENGPY